MSEKELAQIMTTWAKKVVNTTINTSEFSSSQPATRAVFGTLLSRALWGELNDGAVPYYAAHLNALQHEGLLTSISNPMAEEIR
jgi:hypothetical protein